MLKFDNLPTVTAETARAARDVVWEFLVNDKRISYDDIMVLFILNGLKRNWAYTAYELRNMVKEDRDNRNPYISETDVRNSLANLQKCGYIEFYEDGITPKGSPKYSFVIYNHLTKVKQTLAQKPSANSTTY